MTARRSAGAMPGRSGARPTRRPSGTALGRPGARRGRRSADPAFVGDGAYQAIAPTPKYGDAPSAGRVVIFTRAPPDQRQTVHGPLGREGPLAQIAWPCAVMP